jgi:hypothetical protein
LSHGVEHEKVNDIIKRQQFEEDAEAKQKQGSVATKIEKYRKKSITPQ